VPTNLPPPSTIIDLLRHGKVATPDLFCARADEPLGIDGWKQLTRATNGGQWDVVVTSPSRRCHDFARLLAQKVGVPFQVEPAWQEMDFGTWVGRSQTDIWAEDAALMQQLWYQPKAFTAPQGEAMVMFIRRVQEGWDALLAEHAGKRVLVLTHAGVIRVILAKVLEMLYQKTLRFEVGYAQITRFRVYPDGEASLLGHGLPHV